VYEQALSVAIKAKEDQAKLDAMSDKAYVRTWGTLAMSMVRLIIFITAFLHVACAGTLCCESR